ncbi:helix-turn-helix domain-containing protein [Halalkalibacillus halophilus]|uniref:helix-turn-helix domain-containing protein n=1 Tax=Halalkalibacillus halophilus TaxID=392827 RepID=UPI000401AFC0|nr:helix-turn-helix domain-containing protein [Halalkalibacillus halophilus]
MTLIGRTIRWYRVNAGFTQEYIADGICSLTYLSKLENDQVEIKEEVVKEISERLKLPSQLLLGEVDESLKGKIDRWLNYIHIYHEPQAIKRHAQLKHLFEEDLPVKLKSQLQISRFGYYLISDQLKNADTLMDDIVSKQPIYSRADPFSYHKFVGMYYRRKGMYINAVEHLEIAEKELAEENDPELMLVLANVYSRLNEILVSNKYAQKAFQAYQKKMYYIRMIDCQIVIGINYCLVGDFYSAEVYFNRLLDIDGKHLLDKTRANIHHHIGFVQFEKGDYEKAIHSFNRTLEFDMNDSDFLNTRYLLAYIFNQQGKSKETTHMIEEGLEIAKKYQHQRYVFKFNVLKMRIDQDLSPLIDYLEQEVIPFFKSNGEATELKHYYYLMGQLVYEDRKYKKSAQYFMLAKDNFMV